MDKYRRKIRPGFEAETRFEVDPVPAAPFRGFRENALEALKARLLSRLLATTEDGALYAPYRRAASEAAALAWTTPFPLLVFPGLFEEKAEEAARQITKQESVRCRSARLVGAAI